MIMRKREWRLRERHSDFKDETLKIVKDLNLSPLTVGVCQKRGFHTSDQIYSYLYPKLSDLKNPYEIRDMDRAVEALWKTCQKNQKVRIFGDYDVDGTSGAALLSWVFSELGIQFDAIQPDRFRDGYGLNLRAVEEAHRDGVGLLLTVDCGITSFEPVARAHELGLSVVILDHHQVDPRGLPKATAIVNPQRADCQSGLKELCGCGVAFFFLMALRQRWRQAFGESNLPNLKKHLDLVVLATAADLVPLINNNRILVRHGLEVLNRTEKPGFKSLLYSSGLAEKSVSPGHLGFVLGPRINASGRVDSASHALKLLTTRDPLEGALLATELENLNHKRKQLQLEIWDQIRVQVNQEIANGRYPFGVVVANSEWHEGVVGIVASRVTEAFQRPAIVISIRDDHAKGSVRSYAGINVLNALRACEKHLLGYGGHAHAAGLSLKPENILAFEEEFNLALQRSQIEKPVDLPPIYIDQEVQLEDLTEKTILELEQLGPFGPGNPEPVFSVSTQVKKWDILKERHFKMKLGTQAFEAIWFNAAESEELRSKVQNSYQVKLAGVPELNRFRGKITPTLQIKDCLLS